MRSGAIKRGDTEWSTGGGGVVRRVGGEEQIPSRIHDFHLTACGDGNLVFGGTSGRQGRLGGLGNEVWTEGLPSG